VENAHHFSFDPHTKDLMMHRCGLALGLYHLLWDGYKPSTIDGISGCKLYYLQSQHIHRNLADDGDSWGVVDTFNYSYLHRACVCVYSLHWDPSADKGGTIVSMGSIGWLHHFWDGEVEISIEQRRLVSDMRDITQQFPWDPSGVVFS
jgi:hypothetical protein